MGEDIGKYYLLNNRLIPVNELDRDGVSRGFSVYEIVRVKDSVAVFLEDHLHRFYHSLELENLGIKENEQEIKQQIWKLIENNSVRSGKIKFVVNFSSYPQTQDYDLWLYFDHYDPPTADQYKNGVETILCRAVRNDPNVKMIHTKARHITEKKIKE